MPRSDSPRWMYDMASWNAAYSTVRLSVFVEASSASLTNLGASVNEAVKLGATVISNSYGGGESFWELGRVGLEGGEGHAALLVGLALAARLG